MSGPEGERGLGSPAKERAVVAPLIAADEPVVHRHYVCGVSMGDRGETLHHAAVFLTTDRKLVMVTAKGTLWPKYRVNSWAYAALKPGVARSDSDLFGTPLWFSGFGTLRGETYVVRFLTAEERDAYARDLGGALGSWHLIHGEA